MECKMESAQSPVTDRSRVRLFAARGTNEKKAIHEVIDSALYGVGVLRRRRPAIRHADHGLATGRPSLLAETGSWRPRSATAGSHASALPGRTATPLRSIS